MKTICNNRLRIVFICALSLLLPSIGTAQEQVKNGYANIDWQFNIPLNNGFSDKASGWGMNFEGGYYFTPHRSRVILCIPYQQRVYSHPNAQPLAVFTTDQRPATRPISVAFRCSFPLPFHAGKKILSLYRRKIGYAIL